MSSAVDRRLKPLLLFAIVLLAAFFRLYRIDSLPPGDGYGPAYHGVDAIQLLRGEPLPTMLPSNKEAAISFSPGVAGRDDDPGGSGQKRAFSQAGDRRIAGGGIADRSGGIVAPAASNTVGGQALRKRASGGVDSLNSWLFHVQRGADQ